MKTRAAVLYEVGSPFQVETLDLEPPRAGEVLIKMVAAGVCHSDWHLVTGDTRHTLPVVPGHEGAGVIEAVGEEVADLKPGDHVILNWAPNCGQCFFCLRDRPSLCEAYVGPIWAGTMMDGTTRLSKDGRPVYHFSATACFAEYTVVPQECCVPLEETVPFEVGALIGCAVTTGVGAVLNTAQVQLGSRVIVFGAGGVGLNIVMGAKLAGASRIMVVDLSEEKGRMAIEFGATDALVAGPDTVNTLLEMTEGRGAGFVFEAIGIPAVQEQAFAVTRPGGTLVLVGMSPMGSSTNFPGAIVARKEKTVTGSYYGSANTQRDFPTFIEFYQQGMLDLDRLITQTYSLDQINEAYEDMLNGKLARGVIQF
jgi:S-(hydroxymethyl)glutathione dehydrogenase/alcohol dehydrogenase